MNKKILQRQFKFGKQILDDPNPAFSPDKVMSFYANQIPELTTANVSAPVPKNGMLIYEFVTSIGQKG